MRRSIVRLVVSSVLLCWALAFVVMKIYVRSLSWTEARARTDGVFLVHQLLDREPAALRPARLRELQSHSRVGFALATPDEVARRLARRLRPGETARQEASAREHWLFLMFGDGAGALVAGPVDPAIPAGFVPVGAILVAALLPAIAALIALRVEHGLAKVERASRALANGELSARVDHSNGPSKELAVSFNAMAERVERLIRSRDELVQAVSHELGSPLSRLRFHLELLAGLSGEARQARADAMARELDALDDLVAELLTYVQSDELVLEQRAFEPGRCLADLVELAKLEAPRDKAVEVDLELPSATPVVADPRYFQRAVENILRNAVQHAKSRVRLEVSREIDQVRVAIHDDGPGIPAEACEKVLAPFFRLQAGRGRNPGGVGLGLAIVHRIVQRHGGRVEIATSPLGGAMITTSWPTKRLAP